MFSPKTDALLRDQKRLRDLVARLDGKIDPDVAIVIGQLVDLGTSAIVLAGSFEDMLSKANFRAIHPADDFRYEEGETYMRNDGLLVTIVAEKNEHAGYETVEGDDPTEHDDDAGGIHRYNRTGPFEMGRCTGSSWQEPRPSNLIPVKVRLPEGTTLVTKKARSSPARPATQQKKAPSRTRKPKG